MNDWTKEKLQKEIDRYEKRLSYLKNIEESIPGMIDVEAEITECEDILQCLRQKETFNS